MKIQIWGKSKCFDTKKAERYFKERRIPYQAIDLLRYGMSRGELTSVKNAGWARGAARSQGGGLRACAASGL